MNYKANTMRDQLILSLIKSTEAELSNKQKKGKKKTFKQRKY